MLKLEFKIWRLKINFFLKIRDRILKQTDFEKYEVENQLIDSLKVKIKELNE